MRNFHPRKCKTLTIFFWDKNSVEWGVQTLVFASLSGSLTTIQKGLFPMHLLLKKITEVNLKKIWEWRKNNIKESEKEIQSETECDSSKTCYCIQVYISRKVSTSIFYESSPEN